MSQTIKIWDNQEQKVLEIPIDQVQSYGLDPTEALGRVKSQQELERMEAGLPEKVKASPKDRALAKTGIARTLKSAEIYEKDPDVLTKQLMPGKFVSREWDKEMYDAADALLRLRTGAQANPAEIRGYMKRIAPSFGDSPEVVRDKLNNMLENFSFYSGEEPKSIPTTVTNGEKPRAEMMGLGQYLGRGLKGELAIQRQPPTAKEAIGMGAGPLGMLLTRPDVFKETVGPAAEAAAPFLLPGLLRGGKKALAPRKALAEARRAGVKKAPKFLGKAKKELLTEGKDIVRQFPGAEREFKTVTRQIKGAKSQTEFLNMLDSWGRKAFPKGGGVKAAHAADLYSNLNRFASTVLQKYAPKAMKYQKGLRLTREVPKQISKGAYQTLKFGALKRVLGL